ncbi:5-oxoprolinase subunit PxpB [Vibrio algivorus]|uniref:5-oxoprolinase subunit PxpB n=1 Tax=Vibrio algivorus TaxID=1667024 RepID=A0A557P7W8_9VIBR|nr:5-oxoprolinase subunit PxpB [Vibrio algivorus]TVO36750.1 5-oxoprolinase subunit PxpB [Vibrio algivorus]
MKTQIISENTIMVYFTNTIDAETSEKVTQALYALQNSLGNFILDAIPSYHSILITVDILQTGMSDFQQQVEVLLNQSSSTARPLPHLEIELPVYYGEEVALDAAEICAHSGLSWPEVVEIHSQTSYRVYAIGFALGFAYLGNLDSRIQMPRKSTPRTRVPKGSVAIAEQQTAVYPKASPGGWQIIGRTPISLVDFERENLSLFYIGAQVRFKAISRQQFIDMGGDLNTSEQIDTDKGAKS